MRLPARPRLTAVLSLAAVSLFAVPGTLFGHAVVYPKVSAPGAYERYVLRVPNEKDVATTRIEIRFPANARVTSFSDVPGWQLEVVTDSAKRIVGAVWTGTLAPQRFVELPFVAVNPKDADALAWPTFQTYADGQRVEWTGAEGSKTPVSSTTIAKADVTRRAGFVTTTVAWAALVLSFLSLGLAMRPRTER